MFRTEIKRHFYEFFFYERFLILTKKCKKKFRNKVFGCEAGIGPATRNTRAVVTADCKSVRLPYALNYICSGRFS